MYCNAVVLGVIAFCDHESLKECGNATSRINQSVDDYAQGRICLSNTTCMLKILCKKCVGCMKKEGLK